MQQVGQRELGRAKLLAEKRKERKAREEKLIKSQL